MEAECYRKTKETDVKVKINLYGSGKLKVNTNIGFLDHMLELLGLWANFDLFVEARGDIKIDTHHTVEDIGITLGKAMYKALGDKSKIARVGSGKVPMDEALCEVIVDLSGRPYFVYKNSELLPSVIFGEEKDIWREFLKSLCFEAKMNLHVIFHYGKNGHHLIESCFKSLGIALKEALKKERDFLLSTKGVLE